MLICEEPENVAGTYKGGYGFAPFIASVDYGAGKGSGEILAAVLRPGNAGANSAEDHIRIFHTATAQLPEGFYKNNGALAGEKILVRTDSAGASRKFLWHLHSLGVQFSTSYPPEKSSLAPAATSCYSRNQRPRKTS